MINPSESLTNIEKKGMYGDGINLTDGHNYLPHNAKQQAVVARLGEIANESMQITAQEAGERFWNAFFTLVQQPSALDLAVRSENWHRPGHPTFEDSSSQTLSQVWRALRARNMTIYALTPGFDNPLNLARQAGLTVQPVEEEWLLDFDTLTENTKQGALFITTPNNPTGFELDKQQFYDLALWCRLHEILLVMDYSFRLFSNNLQTFDQYQILLDLGVDFIGVEDTGKFFSTEDMKLGFWVASSSWQQPMIDSWANLYSHDDWGGSRFAMLFIEALIQTEMGRAVLSTNEAIGHNRQIFRGALVGSPLAPVFPDSTLSVEWLRLPQDWGANLFQQYCADRGLHVLPGNQFYWDDPRRGDGFIRAALAREEKIIRAGGEKLRELSLAYQPV